MVSQGKQTQQNQTFKSKTLFFKFLSAGFLTGKETIRCLRTEMSLFLLVFGPACIIKLRISGMNNIFLAETASTDNCNGVYNNTNTQR